MKKGFTILCDNCGEKSHTFFEQSKGSKIHNETYERYSNTGDYQIIFECECGNKSELGE